LRRHMRVGSSPFQRNAPAAPPKLTVIPPENAESEQHRIYTRRRGAAIFSV